MKTSILVFSLSAYVAVLGCSLSCAQEKKPTKGTTSAKVSDETKDIVDTAVAAGEFKTLAAALKAAGLVETLKGKGPFTVFAPTDAAFAKLPKGTLDDLLKPANKEKLTKILTFHVLPKKETVANLAKMKMAKTVEGSELKIADKDGKLMIGKAQMTKTDIECANGVIHIVDTVLMPE
ncbi:MAG: fasciclin domain-containing protein [Aureliella sp.]